MGPSGSGKTTLAATNHRPGTPGPRQRRVRRAGSREPPARSAVPHAPAHGHAVPERRAAHGPRRLREHRLSAARAHATAGAAGQAPRADQAAGRRPARRRAADAGGAFGRNGAAGRTRARNRDGPGAAHLRRALRRARPDLHGRRAAADPAPERHARRHQHRGVARRARDHRGRGLLPPAVRRARSSPAGRRPRSPASAHEDVRQFMHGLPDGPVPFHYPAPDYADQARQVA